MKLAMQKGDARSYGLGVARAEAYLSAAER
jgi:hypothetical protein